MSKPPQKKFYIAAENLKNLATGYGAGFATDHIMVRGHKVGFMYRETPDDDIDSGWRFTSGLESEEEMNDATMLGVYDINTIANYDPEIVPFLKSPVGSAFARDTVKGPLVPVEDDSE
ncbi:MAG: DUF2185 domain-containing protein [Bdellovibrionaceae bacterium]|nr:DUF2185 domain-containing protein [Pseudobdellovibrionaceae bacterium]